MLKPDKHRRRNRRRSPTDFTRRPLSCDHAQTDHRELDLAPHPARLPNRCGRAEAIWRVRSWDGEKPRRNLD